MDKKLVSTSKFFSLVLRHKPETIGLELDEEGWADIETLLELAAAHGQRIDRATLDRVVETNDKKRFAISDDGQRIRASQGHSVDVDLKMEPLTPPEQLFHGTVERFLALIHTDGLKKMSRQHVHLSADLETAAKVGGRRGKPVILIVNAGAMHAAGHAFYRSANGVWLTDHVPSDFIEFP